MALRLEAHHMSFPVRNLARSRAFYEGVLGLAEIPRPAGLGIPGVWYRAGACEVHLIETPPGVDVGLPAPSLTPLARHAAFAVGDYEATLKHLREQAERGPCNEPAARTNLGARPRRPHPRVHRLA